MPPRKPRSTRNGRVTMQDVATRAGVSAITVSRALRTPHKVAPLVRERIQQMGFIPVGSSPEQFNAQFKKDAPVWERLVKMSGAKLD